MAHIKKRHLKKSKKPRILAESYIKIANISRTPQVLWDLVQLQPALSYFDMKVVTKQKAIYLLYSYQLTPAAEKSILDILTMFKCQWVLPK